MDTAARTLSWIVLTFRLNDPKRFPLLLLFRTSNLIIHEPVKKTVSNNFLSFNFSLSTNGLSRQNQLVV
jgi:hypothetical protein